MTEVTVQPHAPVSARPRSIHQPGHRMAKLTIHVELSDEAAGGPGQGLRLPELIDEHGSTSAAGRAMVMSYRRAWLLAEEIGSDR